MRKVLTLLKTVAILSIVLICLFNIRMVVCKSIVTRSDADILRLYNLGHHTLLHINPYPISLNILETFVGPLYGNNRIHLKSTKIYSIQHIINNAGISQKDSQLSYPEATYPPNTLSFLAFSISLLPSSLCFPVMMLINIILIPIFIFAVMSIYKRQSPSIFGLGIAVSLLWLPVSDCLIAGQLTLLILTSLLLGYLFLNKNKLIAGIFWSITLLKPSRGISFLFFLLVRKQFLVFFVAVSINLALALITCFMINENLITLVFQWLNVGGYFLQGAFSLQEIINALMLENSLAGTSITLLFLSIVLLWVYKNRASDDLSILNVFCFTSVLWMYHQRYDYIALLIPFMGSLITPQDRRSKIYQVCFIILIVTFFDIFYASEDIAGRIARWAGRLSLAICFIYSLLRLRKRTPAGIIKNNSKGNVSLAAP